MMDGIDLVSEFAGAAAADAVAAARRGDLSGVGQIEDLIQQQLNNYLDKFGPALSTRLVAIAEPAAKKAADLVRPEVESALAKYTPQFAAIAGGMMGLAVLLGVWISKTSRGENL
jgi:hypothetical protein